MVLTQQEICPWIYTWATFPYHYGSHATISRFFFNHLLHQFPYHYGSHATLRYTYQQAYIKTFPYHYGSHATIYLIEYPRSINVMFPYHYGSHATAFITKILYRFWGGRINQSGRSRKRHRIYISAIRLDLILDGRSVMWREKASVSSKEDRSQKIPARHSLAEAYRRKLLSISLSIK